MISRLDQPPVFGDADEISPSGPLGHLDEESVAGLRRHEAETNGLAGGHGSLRDLREVEGDVRGPQPVQKSLAGGEAEVAHAHPKATGTDDLLELFGDALDRVGAVAGLKSAGIFQILGTLAAFRGEADVEGENAPRRIEPTDEVPDGFGIVQLGCLGPGRRNGRIQRVGLLSPLRNGNAQCLGVDLVGGSDGHGANHPAAFGDPDRTVVGGGPGAGRGRAIGGVTDRHAVGLRQGGQLHLEIVAAVVKLVFQAQASGPFPGQADPTRLLGIEGEEAVAQADRLEPRRGRHGAG